MAMSLLLAAQPPADQRRRERLAEVTLTPITARDWADKALGFEPAPPDPTLLQLAFSGDSSALVILLRPSSRPGRMVGIFLSEGAQEPVRAFEEVPDFVTPLAFPAEVRIQDRTGDHALVVTGGTQRKLPQITDESALSRSPDLERIVTFDGRRQVWLRNVAKPEAKTRLLGSLDLIAWDRARGRVAVSTIQAVASGLVGDRLAVHDDGGERLARVKLSGWVRAIEFDVDGGAVLFADQALHRLEISSGEVRKADRAAVWVAVLDPVVGLAHDGKSLFAFDVVSLDARPLEVPGEPKAIHAAAIDWRRQTIALATDRGVVVFSLTK
jgi:hypothetical protein